MRRKSSCAGHALATVIVKRIRLALSAWLSSGLSSAPAPHRPALSIFPGGADRPGPTIACRAPRQSVPRLHPRCARPCRRTCPCPRIRSRADYVHALTHAYAFLAGHVALRAGGIYRIGPGHVHANGRPMRRRQHTHRKPNRCRRRRQHLKRTRPGRPSTARSSHAPGRPVQSVGQRQARSAVAACAGGVSAPAMLSRP